MASAPGAGWRTGPSPGSGSDSVNSFSPFSSDGVRRMSWFTTRPRKTGDWRPISTMGPPATFSTPTRTIGSTAISSVP